LAPHYLHINVFAEETIAAEGGCRQVIFFPECVKYKDIRFWDRGWPMLVLLVMFAVGLSIGFVGAGGAGVVIAVLTVFFGVPIHTALGTSLVAMIFTTLSGSVSHFREHNLVVKEGLIVGIFGAVGAYAGVKLAASIPARDLAWLTAGLLYVCAVLVTLRMFFSFSGIMAIRTDDGMKFWLASSVLGLFCGILSGAFGIGAAPFIQIGLLFFFSMTIPQVAGTTMLVILPIAIMGGIGYLLEGYLDLVLFVQVVAGMTLGAYIGAKFTKRLPTAVLKTAMVVIPIFAATLLLFAP
jgi:uncharacterized protein